MVGGDIGCGMCAVRLPFQVGGLKEKFSWFAEKLRERIPVGTAYNGTVADRVRNNPLWDRELCASVSNRTFRRLMRQFGSLGGGNHFLEIQADRVNRLWIMLHSGSRYLGVDVRDHYVTEAVKQRAIDL
jgi:tRNA-splicing ligase RtcB